MRSEKESGYVGQRKYLLTIDLYKTLEGFARTGLKIPDQSFCESSSQRLIQKLKECLPYCELEVIQFHEVVNRLAALAREISMGIPEVVIVSTIPDVAAKLGGHCLQVNRIVDCSGKMLGIGPRPGYASLGEQFNRIKRDQPVILVEDGSFSGGTVSKIIELIELSNRSIEYLVVGFLFPSAKKNILKVFPDISRIHCLRDDNFLDWMPDHDFYPFLPNSGRVVGYSYNGQVLPVYLHNGLSLSMPYLLPYGQPADWANIVPEKQYEFSIFCIHEAIALFYKMERLNGEYVTLERLLGTHPRASFAVTPKAKGFPHIKERIFNILHDDAHML